jgi:hypothetical protein
MAKHQAQKYAQHNRVNGEEFRKQAARSSFPEIQARLLRIAASNERLCSIVVGTRDVAESESRAELREPAKPSHEAAIKRAEDPVSEARRHVAEAEARIERQEALVARLSDSNKHLSLASEAREILAALKHTLRLARDHLALELRNNSSSTPFCSVGAPQRQRGNGTGFGPFTFTVTNDCQETKFSPEIVPCPWPFYRAFAQRRAWYALPSQRRNRQLQCVSPRPSNATSRPWTSFHVRIFRPSRQSGF